MSDDDMDRDTVAKVIHDAHEFMQEDGPERLAKAEKALVDLKRGMRAQDLQRVASYERSLEPTTHDDGELLSEYMVRRDVLDLDKRILGVNHSVVDLSEDAAEGHNFIGKKGEGDGRVLRMVGCEQHGRYQAGLLDDPEPKNHWQKALQRAATARSLAKLAGVRQTARGPVYPNTPKLDVQFLSLLLSGPEPIRRLFADNAGEGAEWTVPSLTMADLFRKAEVPREVAALFTTVNLMTGDSTKWPFQDRGLQPFIMGVPPAGETDPAQIPQSVVQTSEREMTPKTLGVNLAADRDASEDSLIAFAAKAVELVAEAIRDAREDALINGDVATHGDTGLAAWANRGRWGTLGTSTDHRLWFKGLRHHAIDSGATANIDGGSLQTVIGLAGLLARFSVPLGSRDIAWIMSPEFLLLKMLVDTNLLTVDKYGQFATLLTGEVARIMDRPVILSEFVDVEYNASGIFDNVTTTKTGTVAVNPGRFLHGRRRELRVESQTVARTNTTYTTATARESFMKLDATTTKSALWIYNQDPS